MPKRARILFWLVSFATGVAVQQPSARTAHQTRVEDRDCVSSTLFTEFLSRGRLLKKVITIHEITRSGPNRDEQLRVLLVFVWCSFV